MKMQTLSAGFVQSVLLGCCLLLALVVGGLLVNTARQQADRSLVERAAYETVASNPTPVIVCRNGLIEIVNPAAEEALGVRQRDLIGRDAADMLVGEQYRARHIAATSKLRLLPIGAAGYSNYILPAMDARTGKIEKWLVTTQYRRTEDGDVITVARFVNYILEHSKPWLDVSTNKLIQVRLSLEPVESSPDSVEAAHEAPGLVR